MLGVIASLPTVEGVGADAKIATGKPGIATMCLVVIEPFESLAGSFLMYFSSWVQLKKVFTTLA